jgi:hypothetical protein
MPSLSSLAMTLLVSCCCCMHFALACSCLPLSVNETMQREHIDLVVRGTVLRAFVPTAYYDPAVNATTKNGADGASLFSDEEPKQYIVQVTKVYKGCHVKTNERILVSSNGIGTLCGMSLTVHANYVFSTGVHQPIDPVTSAQLGNRSKVKQGIWISSCGLNQVWSTVAEQDKVTIRNYQKQCPTV